MRILHVLASSGVGGICGIRPSLQMLTKSALGERHSFAMAGIDQLGAALSDWNPDLLIWHMASSWNGLPRLLRQRRRRQILFEHHYCAGFERNNVPSSLRFRTMLRLSYSTMERVVAVSSAQRDWMEQARLLPTSKSCLLRSSRTVEEFLAVSPPKPAHGQQLTLLAYGRLTTQKGFDWLLRAMRHLPGSGLRLLLVGDGPQKEDLASLARTDPRVELLGASKDIPALLARTDAVVIPSRWEPWGNVCLEARAAGRPVIVSNVDGLPEQVMGSGIGTPPQEPCGLVVKEESDTALAAAIDRLLSSTDRQRQAWSEAGRRSAKTAWSDYLANWSHLLDELAST
jgi:glycosyltransferase involved in cell wall biosynthesis